MPIEEDVMKNRSGLLLGIIILLCVFTLWGCPKKTEVAAPETAKQEVKEPTAAEKAAAEKAKAEAEAKAKAEAEAKAKAEAEAKAKAEAEAREKAAVEAKAKAEAQERAAAAAAGLKPIYFDFDRSFIRDDAKAAMKANAEWLKSNPKVKVRIEGNCDERGTKEYNQALGQRRAVSAKKYLTDLGVSATRISLISYGKEKPVCSENSEDCMQKNRRDDLVAVTE
jgi:peptidoglycan-associated lipoprotein